MLCTDVTCERYEHDLARTCNVMVGTNCILHCYDLQFHARNRGGSHIFHRLVAGIHLLILLTIACLCAAIETCALKLAGPANVASGSRPLIMQAGLNQSTSKHLEEGEEMPPLGVGKITDFTQLQMIDLYACVNVDTVELCPASGTGKMLSPMDLITKLRDNLTNTGALVTRRKHGCQRLRSTRQKATKLHLLLDLKALQWIIIHSRSLIGDIITEGDIWACTTCRNCEDQCPVMNEHVDKIMKKIWPYYDRRKNGSGCTTRDENIERKGIITVKKERKMEMHVRTFISQRLKN